MYVFTGGAGFIGSNIVWALESKGLGPITVIDRLDSDEKRRNIAKRDLAEIVEPDATLDFLHANAGAIEAVIHMGAISATTETDVAKIFSNNYRLSLEIWQWCAANEVRLIYASSAATYGNGDQGFDDDNTAGALARLRPMNPYGWSKHQFDRHAVRMVRDGEAAPPQWAGLKFFNVFGPNEFHKGRMQSVVVQVYKTISEGKPCTLFKSHRPEYEDGGQLRDFVWVGDCVDMVLWLLDAPHVSGLFNCGTGKARSFADLARAVYAAVGKPVEINYVDTPEDIRDKYQYFTEARMERIRAAGYDTPPTSLEDGVAAYVRDFLATNDAYR